jgi:hypothetical protein
MGLIQSDAGLDSLSVYAAGKKSGVFEKNVDKCSGFV